MSRVLPILFNTDMVRAILDGRKTVTRRLVGEKVAVIREGQEINKNLDGKFELYNVTQRCGIPQNVFFKPPYLPGDILYVRETWNTKCANCETDCSPICNAPYYVYKADVGETEDKWRPSIHMPKAAARIWLEVTDVRVERLQDITEESARKEGVLSPYEYADNDEYWEVTGRNSLPADIAAFSALWESTIKKSDLDCYGWDANPWVWVIEFQRCEKPKLLNGLKAR